MIEIDGDIHLTEENKLYDANRTVELASFGIKVIRFTNAEVLANPENVLEVILKTIS